MKLKCESCPDQQAKFVIGCSNKLSCNSCITRVKKTTEGSVTAIEQQQQLNCDICKVNPVTVVCHDDRAFLCTQCDLKIHSANDYAGHHHRVAFTGARLALPAGISMKKPESKAYAPIQIRTNKRKNKLVEEEEEEEQEKIDEEQFFDDDAHVVPVFEPVEFMQANDVENVSTFYSVSSSELFPLVNANVPSYKTQKRSSFEDFLGEFIGYEDVMDDAIVPSF